MRPLLRIAFCACAFSAAALDASEFIPESVVSATGDFPFSEIARPDYRVIEDRIPKMDPELMADPHLWFADFRLLLTGFAEFSATNNTSYIQYYP